MNSTAYNSSEIGTTIPEMETIASLEEGSTWRNYHNQTVETHISEWFNFLEGEQYYMSGTTSMQMSVAVEAYTYEEDVDADCIFCEPIVCWDSSTNTTSELTSHTDNTACTVCWDNVTDTQHFDLSTFTNDTICYETIVDDRVCCETAVTYTDHPHMTRSMQQIAFEHTIVLEEWDITIASSDSGTYTLNFVNVETEPPTFYTTETISADADATTVETAINGYYGSVHACDATVAGSGGSYTVTVNKLMRSFSTSGIMALPTADEDKGTEETAATITVTQPVEGQQSSSKFNGTYVVTCTDS